MNDKMYIFSSDLFPLTNPGQGFVTWNGSTWTLNENRWGTYCAEMANRGVNFFRWLGWNPWYNWVVPSAHNLTPFIEVSPGRFDLSQRNETYWNIARRMVEIMHYPAQKQGIEAPGIKLLIDLAFQYANDPDDRAKSPWRNNVQGTTSLYDEANWTFFECFAAEWMGLADETGMGNEMEAEGVEFGKKLLRFMDGERVWPFSWGICPDVPSDDGNDLFKVFPKAIYDENLFLWNPLRQGDRWDTSIIRPTHACGEERGGVDVFETALSYWACLPIRWIASDDGCMGPEGKPGAEWWGNAVRRICTYQGTDALTIPWDGIDRPMLGIEHLPDDKPWDECRVEQLGVFDAIAAAYAETFPPLENFGKWPDAWVDPDPPDPPDPPPTTCGKNHWWEHLKTLNFKAAWDHLLGRHDS